MCGLICVCMCQCRYWLACNPYKVALEWAEPNNQLTLAEFFAYYLWVMIWNTSINLQEGMGAISALCQCRNHKGKQLSISLVSLRIQSLIFVPCRTRAFGFMSENFNLFLDYRHPLLRGWSYSPNTADRDLREVRSHWRWRKLRKDALFRARVILGTKEIHLD